MSLPFGWPAVCDHRIRTVARSEFLSCRGPKLSVVKSSSLGDLALRSATPSSLNMCLAISFLPCPRVFTWNSPWRSQCSTFPCIRMTPICMGETVRQRWRQRWGSYRKGKKLIDRDHRKILFLISAVRILLPFKWGLVYSLFPGYYQYKVQPSHFGNYNQRVSLFSRNY